ncbi:MAG: DUF4421 family protein [Prevotella sp.]|nr:DUF4421 family protein [Prevotella sp.]
MKKVLLLLFTLHVSLLASLAQPDTARIHRHLRLADSVLSARYYGGNIDTNYIHRPKGRLTVKLRYNLSGATIEASGAMTKRFSSHTHADFKGTLSVAATYRGVSAGLALNPRALLGKYKDYELNLNSYGNRMGFDFIFQRAKNFAGWVQHNNEPRMDIPGDLMTVRSLNLNGYYAFNHRRFSYPAAFTQSYIQRRSAGSWMVGASFQGQYLQIRADEQMGNQSAKLQVVNCGIGGGYGYNLVLPHQWLIHLSSLPTFIVFSRNRMWLSDERQTIKYRFPEVIITGRGAIVHSWNRYFVGSTMVFNFTAIGDEDQSSKIRCLLQPFFVTL